MNDAKYIGLDVHQATICAAVLDSARCHMGSAKFAADELRHCWLLRLCVVPRQITSEYRKDKIAVLYSCPQTTDAVEKVRADFSGVTRHGCAT